MPLTPEQAETIVQDYGHSLEHSAPAPGCVADVDELPHGKRLIKEAIAMYLAHISDAESRDHLKTAYMSLANWQDGVGEKHLGPNGLSLDQTGDIKERAERFLERMPSDMEDWSAKVTAELESLKDEFEALESSPPTSYKHAGPEVSLTDIADTPEYDAAGTEASKSGIFWFFLTFAYLVFFTPTTPKLLSGAVFAIVGMFAVSIFIAAPLFMVPVRFGWNPWFFKLTCAPATIAATWVSYHWLFGA